MTDFYTRKPIAVWRIVVYGLIAASGVALIGYLVNDYRLYIAAAFCGAFIAGFGYLCSWVRANRKPERFPRWIFWLFWLALLTSTALKLWDLFYRK
jgi:FtsH-binding integral membrane protein